MKQKRKAHPYNLRQYWIIFSLLAITLLIPFRIVGFWILTNIIYISISIVIGIVLLRFIRRYSWKRWIVALMMICVVLPIFQVYHNTEFEECEVVSTNELIQRIQCRDVCNFTLPKNFIVLRNTILGIEEKHPIMSYLIIMNPHPTCIINGLN